ncbi:MAG TPA: hypothetical protein VFP52_07295 [Myxococcales bacterium]|nr:hypothetical protein [Myxococcales bacterium]HET9752748.1 hypothetical protein [Myxococcales bacterium]
MSQATAQKAPAGAAISAPTKRGGGAVGGALAKTAGGLVSVTTRIFGEVASRGETALADFRARPEHSRWRAYTLGIYGVIVAATLAGQLYTSNALDAYVRVQRVELPAMTQIFVRNDSRKPWRDVTITLNGIYDFHADEVAPGGHVMLPVNKFAVHDHLGKATYAPRNIAPKNLVVATDGGRYETELGE